MSRTNTDIYHGASIGEEIAALISLSLGVRLKSGPAIRRFEKGSDPRGRPVPRQMESDPWLPPFRGIRSLIPRLPGQACVNDAHRLAKLHVLSRRDAADIIRAARLYQDAVWTADSEPELAWIRFVSAAECGAQRWKPDKKSRLDRIRCSDPTLGSLLDSVAPVRLRDDLARHLLPLMRSTDRFVRFMIAFMPKKPGRRPPDYLQIAWNDGELARTLRTVYKWRSKALHEGTPFPKPMCQHPMMLDGVPGERPMGLAAASDGGVWTADDTPMLLHVFEHMVRGALLNWWDALLKGGEGRGVPTGH